MTIHEILYPTDFSDCAQYAGRYAAGVARTLGASLHILHVACNRAPSKGEDTVSMDAGRGERREVAAQIEALRGATDFQGLGLRTTVACGPTEEEIQSAAQASDLLVMGSHGRTGLARVMLGSVAEAVAGTACCPLMIIKHPDIKIALPWGGHLPAWRSPGQESARFLNILVPLDGSPRSEMILEGVKELARAYEAVILLLMGISAPLRLPGVAPGEVTPADQTQVTSYLRQKQTALHKDGLMAETVVRTGDDAALDILEYAQERAVDLIAMTTHGWSGLQRWPLGSVAGKVLRASPVPVLLYRAWGEAK